MKGKIYALPRLRLGEIIYLKCFNKIEFRLWSTVWIKRNTRLDLKQQTF